MKRLIHILYTLVGALLAWGVYAPLFFSLMFLWFTPRFYLMRTRAKLNGTFGSSEYRRQVTAWQANYSHVTTRLFELVMFMRIKIRVQSGPIIQPGKSYIVIANHISWFDTVYFPGVCERLKLTNVRYVIKESFLRYRIARFVLAQSWIDAGFPFITRTNAKIDIQRIEDASRLALQEGASMLIFPEGTRQPNDIIGQPKWRGFAAQEKLLAGCQIVSLTQCLDKMVGPTIWTGHTYFLRTIFVDVKVHQPLAADVDRKAWLEKEFEHKAELIKAIRT